MATAFAERPHQGVGRAEDRIDDVRDAFPLGTPEQIDAQMAGLVRRARRGVERATDGRDEARIAIKRHPFATVACAFGVGAVLGVAAARLASACTRKAEPAVPAAPEDVDVEC